MKNPSMKRLYQLAIEYFDVRQIERKDAGATLDEQLALSNQDKLNAEFLHEYLLFVFRRQSDAKHWGAKKRHQIQ